MLSRHAIQSLWPDVYRTLIKGTGCDQGAQKQSNNVNKSQIQTVTVNQDKTDFTKTESPSCKKQDKVVKQTKNVKKSDMTKSSALTSNKTSNKAQTQAVPVQHEGSGPASSGCRATKTARPW